MLCPTPLSPWAGQLNLLCHSKEVLVMVGASVRVGGELFQWRSSGLGPGLWGIQDSAGTPSLVGPLGREWLPLSERASQRKRGLPCWEYQASGPLSLGRGLCALAGLIALRSSSAFVEVTGTP